MGQDNLLINKASLECASIYKVKSKKFAFRYAAVNVDKMLLAGGFLIAASNNADKVHFPPHIPIRLSITSSLSTSCCSFL